MMTVGFLTNFPRYSNLIVYIFFFTMFANQLNCWDSDNTEYHPSTDAKHGSSHNLQRIDEIFGN